MKVLKIILLFCVSVVLYSCTLPENEYDEKDKTVQVTVFVAAETGTYRINEDPDTAPLYVGIQYRERGQENWNCNSMTLIDGFTYEQGFEYELLVEKTIFANPPADGGRFTYKLIKIVSKVKVAD
mgnify:CR=1 FL=1